jgi:hypothetical protein
MPWLKARSDRLVGLEPEDIQLTVVYDIRSVGYTVVRNGKREIADCYADMDDKEAVFKEIKEFVDGELAIYTHVFRLRMTFGPTLTTHHSPLTPHPPTPQAGAIGAKFWQSTSGRSLTMSSLQMHIKMRRGNMMRLTLRMRLILRLRLRLRLRMIISLITST